MLVGTALAVFLIVRPPGETKGASPVFVGKLTPTATAAGGTAVPTVAAKTPEVTATAPADATATAAAAVSPTVTVSPFGEHVVVEGDTLLGIAQANLSPGDDVVQFARAIANLNGLDYDNPNLRIGQTLLLPKPQ